MGKLEDILQKIDMKRLPRHVAMIMDGNGRWARARGLERSEGHSEGVASVHRVTEFSSNLGIEYLTLYAFSTENWNRPQAEVDTLMHLIGWAIERELPDLMRNNVSIHLVGDIARIPEGPRAILLDAVRKTSVCTGMKLRMCLSYSSRWEIADAAKRMASDMSAGLISAEDASSSDPIQLFDSYLNPQGIPDPDLLIRTGGECRVSNFLLWQIAYTELYFSPVLWPDFGHEEYAEAILDYQQRQRRFGKTGDQISSTEDTDTNTPSPSINQ